MSERKYLPTLAELIDRLSIIQLKEVFISEHSKSQLKIIVVDYRPIAEVIFSKRSLDKKEINFEDFIAVKGIKAKGNQLTTDKIKQVNLL